MEIKVDCHRGSKCPRCWHYHYLPNQPDNLCDRCQAVLIETLDVNDKTRTAIIKSRNIQKKRYCVRPDEEFCPHEKCCRILEL